MKEFEGKIVSGHQVASGLAQNSPFDKGTIALQRPYFLDQGLDLSKFFNGTLNIDLGFAVKLSHPDYQYQNIKWCEQVPAESFSFFKCYILNNGQWLDSFIYYPHPETKIGHFQKNSVIEVLSPFIKNIHYGDKVWVKIQKNKLGES